MQRKALVDGEGRYRGEVRIIGGDYTDGPWVFMKDERGSRICTPPHLDFRYCDLTVEWLNWEEERG